MIVRSKTNDNHLGKQYCILAKNPQKGFEPAIIIRRLVLVDNVHDYLLTGHVLLKRFKDKTLMGKTFSIKLSTINQMVNWANELNQ